MIADCPHPLCHEGYRYSATATASDPESHDGERCATCGGMGYVDVDESDDAVDCDPLDGCDADAPVAEPMAAWSSLHEVTRLAALLGGPDAMMMAARCVRDESEAA